VGVALIVFALSFGAYVWTASPALGWLDSPELVAATATLGVPHPPSHPPAVLIAKAWQLIPFGDVAVRCNLASALAVAAAAAFLTAAGETVVGRAAPSLAPRTRALLAAAVALAVAFSFAAWHQAVRAEVYGVLAACSIGALALLLRDRSGPLAGAGLLAGLALATHWFVAALWLAPAAATQLGRRAARAAALLAVLGLASLSYLPLRAARDPAVNWGDPDTAGRFAWTVSARAFSTALERPAGARGHETAQVLGAVIEQLTPVVFLAALAGAYFLLRRREGRRTAALLVGVAVCVSLGPALVEFDPQNPDAYGYLLPALAALALLALAGLAIVAEALPPRLQLVAALAAAALVPWQIAAHAREASLRGGEASDRWARLVFERAPPRALLVTSYFETEFLGWALAAVEGARPDVERVDLAMGARPRDWLAESARRPVRVEPGFDAVPEPRLAPLALVDDDTLDALARGGGGAPEDRRGLERALLWQSYGRARLDCDMRALARVSSLAPDDPVVGELRSGCNR
jgi:hypothetical protein